MISKTYLVEKTGVLILLMLAWVIGPSAQGFASEVNNAPTIVVPASASPNPVTGKTTTLKVLGADDGGASKLVYTWKVTSQPSGAATPPFTVNSCNRASTTMATFNKAGTYAFTVTVSDAGGLSVSSTTTVTVLKLY